MREREIWSSVDEKTTTAKNKKIQGETDTIPKRSMAFMLVIAIWLINSVLRIYFALLAVTGVQLLDAPVSPVVMETLIGVFVILGVGGLVTTYGLWRMNRWGFWGVILVGGSTIAFDIWGLTLQFTAALGFIVPVIALVYLALHKSKFLTVSTTAETT